MNHSLSFRSLTVGRPGVRAMAVLWPLILGKCALVVWAIDRWSVPIAPAWIVVPTLAFAALATVLWLAHRDG